MARAVFLHQRVFCPQRSQVVPLSPLPDGEGSDLLGAVSSISSSSSSPGSELAVGLEEGGGGDELAFLGPLLPAGLAQDIACGERQGTVCVRKGPLAVCWPGPRHCLQLVIGPAQLVMVWCMHVCL